MLAIGVDIGGSHLSTALVEMDGCAVLEDTVHRVALSPQISIKDFISTLLSSIDTTCGKLSTTQRAAVAGIGFAFPGPFLYNKGICTMQGVEKFDELFGVDIRTTCKSMLRDKLMLPRAPITFVNDAQAFLLGAVAHENLTQSNVIGVTVGTGIGSAFYSKGTIVENGDTVPENGYLYSLPYRDSTAEEYISTRWFLRHYPAGNVEAIARAADAGVRQAISLFNLFGTQLAEVLSPWCKRFNADVIVLGGGVFHSWHLIKESFLAETTRLGISIRVIISSKTEIMNISGAIKDLTEKNDHTLAPGRKTEQHLLPSHKENTSLSHYDVYPAHRVVNGSIQQSLDQLVKLLPDQGNIILDGYGGIYWDKFVEDLTLALTKNKKKAQWYSVEAALKPSSVINDMIAPFLNSDGDDSIFGKLYPGTLQDFFDPALLQKISSPDEGLNIAYGTGASLAGWKGALIYLDIPKNEIQFRSRAGAVRNLGDNATQNPKDQYKRFYFIDWPVLNRHKEELLKQIDFIIDGQQTDFYPWLKGDAFRETLSHMSKHPFRVRPWFEPGVWGGQWLRENIPALPQNVPNYAWSFELITPENGILFEDKGSLLEISFDWLMYANAKEILGRAQEKFGSYFPIRFDYLDTFDGGNLSVQCHPSLKYAQENFGELITQDETYYILDQAEDSGVYIGFTETTDAVSFEKALRESQETQEAIDITKHVQLIPSKKHDLFLIPNCTVHGAGINNLVLEISSTPYIFTFKLYDWVRKDLEGNTRPINIDHGMKNLDFSRKGDRVQKELISHPVLLKKGDNYEHWHLPTHREHFYDVERYEWEGSITISTKEQCHILMLVEGSQIRITAGAIETVYNYAETIVVPAATETYTITYLGIGKAMLVKAFVKDEFLNTVN